MIQPKGHDEHGPILVMSAAEVIERNELNIANTTSALRQRRAAALAQSNGHGGKEGHPPRNGW